ncbi:hypothetical protein LZD49_30520 [Dyadobacter sp. CY261]|uniref:hypothetical protein n=1 Tax=Dyadobacter sp. CY261 TaxID=2907203 RepID=UPI001F2D0FA6|nr:hypothetical protein [Dyadobacter sp. CY261]MCF0074861.1 hypothetical protein [Dyadobacter sp. CY261]
MEKSVNLNIPLSFEQLLALIRQLSRQEQAELVSVLKEEIIDDEPTKDQILDDLKEDLIALKKGTLKTRPIEDILNEL